MAASVVIGGCGKDGEQATQQAATEVAGAPAGSANGAAGVLAKRLKAALARVGLRAEQQAQVDKLLAKTDQRLAPLRQRALKLGAEVAAQIRSGKVDGAKLLPQLAQLRVAALTQRPALLDGLNELHQILDAKQRTALVEQVKKRHKARHHRRGKLVRLAKALDLTDEQMVQLARIAHRQIASADPVEHVRRFLAVRRAFKQAAAAFISDSFDAHQLELVRLMERRHKRAGKVLAMAAEALPLLTPEQRDRLAKIVEQRLAHHAPLD